MTTHTTETEKTRQSVTKPAPKNTVQPMPNLLGAVPSHQSDLIFNPAPSQTLSHQPSQVLQPKSSSLLSYAPTSVIQRRGQSYSASKGDNAMGQYQNVDFHNLPTYLGTGPSQLASTPSALSTSSTAQRQPTEPAAPKSSVVPRLNNTGLPDNLKAGVESLSGYSMDDVQVHYNSPKPAQFHAHAYTQGTDIHVAPGQEKHLPHEAWHVVQQKQGRVRPTMDLKGVGVNDDAGLEHEAEVMGAKALQITHGDQVTTNSTPLQRAICEADHRQGSRPALRSADNQPEVAALQGQVGPMFDTVPLRSEDHTEATIQRIRTKLGRKIDTDGITDADELQNVVDMVSRGEAYEETAGEVHALGRRIHEARNRGRFRNPPLNSALEKAWPSVSHHAMNVEQFAPDAVEDTREEGTRARLSVATPNGFHEVNGRSGKGPHAESDSYDQVWESANIMANKWVADKSLPGGPNQHYSLQRQFFDQMISGSKIKCDGHKASCFMCSAIAGSLKVKVEKSDYRGYLNYQLPNFLLESPLHLREFLGEQAYTYYLSLRLEDQATFLRQFAVTLYQNHKGKGKYFKPPRDGGGKGGGGMGGSGMGGGGMSGGGMSGGIQVG